MSLKECIGLFAKPSCPAIGGQAVIEGVMMRNGDVYGIAIRKPDGEIYSACSPWLNIFPAAILNLPFIRGFPILFETVANGVRALNFSASIADGGPAEKPLRWELALSLCMAVILAAGLFVLAPHLLSLLMVLAGASGDVDRVSFHFWDGIFKCAIFLFYIYAISFVPEIRRVFEYHGAEHKTIHAFEQNLELVCAERMSRLHPRCGTTFFLFVIVISIILQAALVPPILALWHPEGMIWKHVASLVLKLALIIPISCLAYELIRFSAKLPEGALSAVLQMPGLLIQKLTTAEPDACQLEVAAAALTEALSHDADEEDFAPGI